MQNGKPFVKSPAFQIYPADFLADQNTLVMSAAEVGAYWLLLCVCWRENGLPNSLFDLAAIARIPLSRFKKSWEARIQRCFVLREDGKWTHKRLQEERDKQIDNREKRKVAGAKGATERWQTDSNAITEPKPNHSEPIAKNSLSSSSSSSISTSTSKEKKERHAKIPRDERLDHPALQAVREIRGRYPDKDVWDLVIKTIGLEPDVGRMRECWLAWRGKDFRPNNLGWLTDWYISGIPGGSNGTNRQHSETASERRARNFNNQLAIVAELRGEGGGDRDEGESGKRVPA